MIQPTFRGIDKETNQWAYGFGWQKTDYTEDYLKELGQSEQDAILYTKNGTVLCDLSTIGRSTEQRDSKNKELFEGDVCIFTPMLVENKKSFRGVIVWDKWRFTIQNLDYSPKDLYTTPLVEFDLFGVDVRFTKTIHD